MEQRLEGMADVKLLVNEKGAVEKALVEKSDAEIFNQPSIDAALKWQFMPAQQKGVAVSAWVMIP